MNRLRTAITHFKRRWFVVVEDADRVLSNLFIQRKPVRDATT
ncbi:MAG: hypothetical protein AB7O38_30320 [Pirellulaceae bacterium]